VTFRSRARPRNVNGTDYLYIVKVGQGGRLLIGNKGRINGERGKGHSSAQALGME